MTRELLVEATVHFERGRRGTKKATSEPDTRTVRGRLPRITRLMALAIHFDRLVRDGDVRDYVELAELGQVSRARVTQIMNLTNLAPDIQEAILFLPRQESGRDKLHLAQLQKMAGNTCWNRQRREWRELLSTKS
ncbi:MAG: hypothetical protein ACO3FE_17930 [Planctomycetaceae bacterium]